MEEKLTLTEGRVSTTILKFAIPFLLASLLQALYGAADLLIVGQFSDTAAISAVATGSQVMQTITGVILGLTTGGTVLIGQYLGAKKDKEVAKTIGSMISIFTIIAVVLTIIMISFSGQITSLMNTPTEAIKFTNQYILICSAGIPFIVGYNVVSGILRGLGNSKVPLYFIAVACVINIGADILLVGVFKMGAAGAAIATIAAQGVSLISACIYISKSKFAVRFKRKYIVLKSDKASNILKLGLPIAMQDGLINVSFLLITVIINNMGLIASAAVGVVEKIIIFAMLIPTAFGAAIAVMTAQNMGAGQVERAKKSLYVGIGFSLIFGVIFCLYSQWFGSTLTVMFSKDSEVIAAAVLYLKSYSIDCILVAFIFCMNSFFSGCGHSMFPMIHSCIATFLVRIPGSYILSKVQGFTLYEIGFAAPVATLVSLIICMAYFYSEKWKKNEIVN